MTDLQLLWRRAAVALAIGLGSISAAAQTVDYIVAVVNTELVTASELQQRLARVRDDATRSRTALPPPAVLRKQVLDTLIDERVLVTAARETGTRIDDAELDRAVTNVATQNQMTLPQLRERLRQEGIQYNKFRDNIRDQLMVERVREREVVSMIKISDAEIDAADREASQRRRRGHPARHRPDPGVCARWCRPGGRRRATRARPGGTAPGPQRRGFRRRRARDLGRQQPRPWRRDRAAHRRSPARSFRRHGAVAAAGSDRARAGAQRRRLSRHQADRPQGGQSVRHRSVAGAPYPVAALARAHARGGGAAPARLQARNPGRNAHLRAARARRTPRTRARRRAAISAGSLPARSSRNSRRRSLPCRSAASPIR